MADKDTEHSYYVLNNKGLVFRGKRLIERG